MLETPSPCPRDLIQPHLFIDDSQVYFFYPGISLELYIDLHIQLLHDISAWTLNWCLKPNIARTEVFVSLLFLIPLQQGVRKVFEQLSSLLSCFSSSLLLTLFFFFFLPHFPNKGLNLCPLGWKLRALTTGPPGKTPFCSLSPVPCTLNFRILEVVRRFVT